MKKFFSMFFVLAIVVCMGITAFAADESREYLLELSANTASEIKAQPGDVITLTVALKQVKSDGGDNIIYAMQDEIRYDDEFVEVMDEMMLTANNIRTADVELMGGDKAFYINFLSMEKGTSWPQNAMLATFQVKVLGEHGATKLKNENVKISTKDGSDSYVCAVQDVTIIVSEDCTIFFDSKGGSDVESIRVDIGKTIPQPEDPVKEGYVFDGWYTDESFTDKWDFAKDKVESNMTLYAKWIMASEAETIVDNTGDCHWCWLWILLVLVVIYVLYKKYKSNHKK